MGLARPVLKPWVHWDVHEDSMAVESVADVPLPGEDPGSGTF